jgi:hypothetical protein
MIQSSKWSPHNCEGSALRPGRPRRSPEHQPEQDRRRRMRCYKDRDRDLENASIYFSVEERNVGWMLRRSEARTPNLRRKAKASCWPI